MNLYIHVPFCAQRCSYCDFYTQTKLGLRSSYVEALLRELECRRPELPDGESLQHIYFGGGTPSLLSPEDLGRIFEQIDRLYPRERGGEVTLEANPDDVTSEYAAALRNLPINRVSMGLQSFQETDLRFLNRRHTTQQAISAVDLLRQNGITELSLDLIYGLPGQTLEAWNDNISQILSLEVPHISAYHLIYEEDTPLMRALNLGKVIPVEEKVSLAMLHALIERLTEAGYQHYEISNFALPGHYAQLNTGYWQGAHYLGLGPAAHSYDGFRRSHNVASIEGYVDSWERGERLYNIEELSKIDLHNEYIMTRLRTMWGIDLTDMARVCGTEAAVRIERLTEPYVRDGKLTRIGEVLQLSSSGIFISDSILVELFL